MRLIYEVVLKVLKQRCKPIVWDQFRAHKTEKVKEKLKALKTTQAMIPGGLTSVLQPLDVVINKPFKDRLRQKWVEWMSSDDKPLTKGGNLKKPALALVTSWVKSAWYDLPQEMVKKSFLKTGISNNLDGSEDDFLWDDGQDEEEGDNEASEQYIPPSWDTDEDLPPEQWNELFGNSADESDFDGYYRRCCVWF